jgi:hypothetical protein
MRAREGETKGRRDHEISAGAFLGVRHLARQQRIEAFLRHAGPGQNPRALHRSGRRDDSSPSADGISAGFIEERHIEYDDRGLRQSVVREEMFLHMAGKRVHDTLERMQEARIGQNARAQDFPVYATIRPRAAGNEGLDRRYSSPARRV